MPDVLVQSNSGLRNETQAKVGADAGERQRLRRVLLVVLCLHLVVALLSWRGLIKDDAESYVVIGRNLAQGNGFVFEAGRTPTAWRAPGYPVFLAGIFSLTGGSLIAARLAQAFLWTLTAFLTYALGRRFLRSDTALIAAALAGLYPELLGMSGLLWSESVFVPLFLGAIYAVFCNAEKPQIKVSLLTGILIGLAILTRSTALILIPFVWFAALTKGRTGAAYLNAALATVLTVGITVCWTARNFAVLGKPILVESNTGYNLYVGNQPDTPVPFAWRRGEQLPDDAQYQSLIANKNEAERYTALTQFSIAEMKAQPAQELKLAAGKTFDFWLPDFFIALNVRAGAFGTMYAKAWPIVALITISAYFVMLFAAVRRGWETRRTWETRAIVVILALYTLPHLLVYGASRYHLPLLPLLFLLAAPKFQAWFARRFPKWAAA